MPTPRPVTIAAGAAAAERGSSPANQARRREAHHLFDQALDRMFSDPSREFGRVTVDAIIQHHTIQFVGAGFVPHEK